MAKKISERKEAFIRIPVGIITGIVLVIWRYLIFVFMMINFVYTIFAGKRLKQIAEMSEMWNTQWYVFQRYLIFESNTRPFPFTNIAKSMSKFEK